MCVCATRPSVYTYTGLRRRPSVDELIPYIRNDTHTFTLPTRSASILATTRQTNALECATLTYVRYVEDRLEPGELRHTLIREYASTHTVSTAHAQAIAPPTRPPQQFDISNEPSLDASTEYEDIASEYRPRERARERDVAGASDELSKNQEQHQGVRERGAGVSRFLDNAPRPTHRL